MTHSPDLFAQTMKNVTRACVLVRLGVFLRPVQLLSSAKTWSGPICCIVLLKSPFMQPGLMWTSFGWVSWSYSAFPNWTHKRWAAQGLGALSVAEETMGSSSCWCSSPALVDFLNVPVLRWCRRKSLTVRLQKLSDTRTELQKDREKPRHPRRSLSS